MQQELNLEAWKRARLMAYWMVKPHLKNQNLSVTDFMPLPGDEQKGTEQEALDVIEYYKKQGWLKTA